VSRPLFNPPLVFFHSCCFRRVRIRVRAFGPGSESGSSAAAASLFFHCCCCLLDKTPISGDSSDFVDYIADPGCAPPCGTILVTIAIAMARSSSSSSSSWSCGGRGCWLKGGSRVCACLMNKIRRRCSSGCHVHDQKIELRPKTEARQMTDGGQWAADHSL